VEASAAMEPFLDRQDDCGPDVRMLLAQGRLISGADYVNAQRLRRTYQRRWAEVWERADVIFTPTAPIEAPEIGQTAVEGEDIRLASTRLVRPFNVLGAPAISIPLSTSGLPAGLQIAARAFGEREVIGIAHLMAN